MTPVASRARLDAAPTARTMTRRVSSASASGLACERKYGSVNGPMSHVSLTCGVSWILTYTL